MIRVLAKPGNRFHYSLVIITVFISFLARAASDYDED
jgi:hypothetical protein